MHFFFATFKNEVRSMKNYRFLALPMAMLLIGSAFTGCGSKNDSSAGDSTSTSATDTSREDAGFAPPDGRSAAAQR